jgi:hypothetical protein
MGLQISSSVTITP